MHKSIRDGYVLFASIFVLQKKRNVQCMKIEITVSQMRNELHLSFNNDQTFGRDTMEERERERERESTNHSLPKSQHHLFSLFSFEKRKKKLGPFLVTA